jgi:hypothetical protein
VAVFCSERGSKYEDGCKGNRASGCGTAAEGDNELDCCEPKAENEGKDMVNEIMPCMTIEDISCEEKTDGILGVNMNCHEMDSENITWACFHAALNDWPG